MENVTDQTSNPFGMRPDCSTPCGEHEAVFGYGDANADFHVVGDHPGVHGGRDTGIPFTGSDAGRRLRAVLADVGLLADADATAPTTPNLFLSYLHMCCPPDGETPSADDYADLERLFDAELRAIAAHVLLPVGERATRWVLENCTARPASIADDMSAIHATDVKGSGWLVVPVADPADWVDTDADRLRERLQAVLESDYRQASDLGRFLVDQDSYIVR